MRRTQLISLLVAVFMVCSIFGGVFVMAAPEEHKITLRASSDGYVGYYVNDKDEEYTPASSISEQFLSNYSVHIYAEPQEGYKFTGWRLNGATGALVSESQDYEITVDADATFYAVFEELEEYTFTFVCPQYYGDEFKEVIVPEGEEYELSVLSVNGYEFTGLNDQNGHFFFISPYYPDALKVMPSMNMTCTAALAS